MLPKQFAQASLREIAVDRQRGASELARRSLELAAEYARLLEGSGVSDPEELRTQLIDFSRQLQVVRPSMVPIENLQQRLLDSLETLPVTVHETTVFINDLVQAIAMRSRQAVAQTAIHAGRLIKPGAVVFTHSLSSTIVEVFRQTRDLGVKAIITESRPGDEGRLLAQTLSELKISTQYITDAQLGLFIHQSDLVLVGADAILTDGSVINKAGTYLAALTARDNNVPFYVCCESHKRSSKTLCDIELEEKSGDELNLPVLPSVKARNIYFDVTPKRLIDAYVSEIGIEES